MKAYKVHEPDTSGQVSNVCIWKTQNLKLVKWGSKIKGEGAWWVMEARACGTKNSFSGSSVKFFYCGHAVWSKMSVLKTASGHRFYSYALIHQFGLKMSKFAVHAWVLNVLRCFWVIPLNQPQERLKSQPNLLIKCGDEKLLLWIIDLNQLISTHLPAAYWFTLLLHWTPLLIFAFQSVTPLPHQTDSLSPYWLAAFSASCCPVLCKQLNFIVCFLFVLYFFKYTF